MATKSQKQNASEKTAGEDKSKDVQTTDQAAEKQAALENAGVEERGETDAKAAASGSTVGGVVDGDTDFVPEDADDDEDYVDFESDTLEGATGVVAERNAEGDEFDVPYTYLTVGLLPRTSDSDDPAKDWTAQHAGGERQDEDGHDLEPVALVPVEGTPGQTFRARELPNREVAERAGIDYDQWVAGLPVRLDVPNEAPRKGIPA